MFSIILSHRNIQRPLAPPILRLIVVGLILLLAGQGLQAQIVANGAVSGQWNGQVRVVGNIWVPMSDTLVIAPGTRISFEGNFSLEVNGMLLAQGIHGQPIVFTGNALWRGIYFRPSADPSSQLFECEIVNAWIGVQTERTSIGILNCSIDAVSIGINSIDASPNISANYMIRARSDDTQEGSVRAISLNGRSNPLITNNSQIIAISNQRGSAFGIWITSASPTIEANWIDAISVQSAVSIYARGSEKIRIRRNIIRANSNVMMRGVWTVYSTIDLISNDVFLLTSTDNATGLIVGNGSTVKVINNIIYGNGRSVGDSTLDGRVDSSSGYNNYFNHYVNHVGEWQGYEEVTADPLFENFEESNYHLTRDEPVYSPCIDAGHPDIIDPDDRYRTRSDIGRYCFVYQPNAASGDPAPVANGFILHPAFPNPFNRTTQFSFELALPGPASVAVFDLSGRRIQSLWDSPAAAGVHQIVWSATGLPAGEYLIRLDASDRSQTSRVVFLP